MDASAQDHRRGRTSDVWLQGWAGQGLRSCSWDGGSYSPYSLTQRFCGHPPTHTHTHTCVPCVSGRWIQKCVCQDRAGVEFSGHRLEVQSFDPYFSEAEHNYYFKPFFCLLANFSLLIHVKLHQSKVSVVNSGLFVADEPGKACVVLRS